MVFEISRRLERMLAGEQLWAADGRDAQIDQPFNLDTRHIAPTVEYGHVRISEPGLDRGSFSHITLAVHTDATHTGGNMHVDFRMRCDKAMQTRHQPARSER